MQNRERLRESEASLQAAVDLVKLGRYAWDPQTNGLQWDDTLRAMWDLAAGVPEDYEVWRAGVRPDDLARVEKPSSGVPTPERRRVRYRVSGDRKNDGVERWISTRGQTKFENGGPVSFYGVALDIRDRKESK